MRYRWVRVRVDRNSNTQNDGWPGETWTTQGYLNLKSLVALSGRELAALGSTTFNAQWRAIYAGLNDLKPPVRDGDRVVVERLDAERRIFRVEKVNPRGRMIEMYLSEEGAEQPVDQ